MVSGLIFYQSWILKKKINCLAFERDLKQRNLNDVVITRTYKYMA